MDKEELLRQAEEEFEASLDQYIDEWEQTLRQRMEGNATDDPKPNPRLLPPDRASGRSQ